jgi:hypothetical protein
MFTFIAQIHVKMSVSPPEAREFLTTNQELLDEMIRYYEQRPANQEDAADGDQYDSEDDLLMSRYHKLRTYILEKKMGLLNTKSGDRDK